MSERHWIPLHVGDYLADTPDFTAAEHGAYLLLIMYYWKNGGLPKGEGRVRKISRLTPPAWKRSGDLLRSKFLPSEYDSVSHTKWDSVSHKRLDSEIAKLQQKQRQNSANAKRKHSPRTTTKEENSSKRNSPPPSARSLALEAPARSPTLERYQPEPDPFVIDDEDYARRMNPPVEAGQITRLPK